MATPKTSYYSAAAHGYAPFTLEHKAQVDSLVDLGSHLGEPCEHEVGLYYDITNSVWRCSRCKMEMP